MRSVSPAGAVWRLLRSGAIARFSPIMEAVIRFAQQGGRVIGICNGFQILLESGLLEGAMLHNASGKFICKPVYLHVSRTDSQFTRLSMSTVPW